MAARYRRSSEATAFLRSASDKPLHCNAGLAGSPPGSRPRWPAWRHRLPNIVERRRSCIAAGLPPEELGGVAHHLRSLELALRVDHLRTASRSASAWRAIARRIVSGSSTSFTSTRSPSRPWVGEIIDDRLEPLVDLFAVDQQVVQVYLSEGCCGAWSGRSGRSRAGTAFTRTVTLSSPPRAGSRGSCPSTSVA